MEDTYEAFKRGELPWVYLRDLPLGTRFKFADSEEKATLVEKTVAAAIIEYAKAKMDVSEFDAHDAKGQKARVRIEKKKSKVQRCPLGCQVVPLEGK